METAIVVTETALLPLRAAVEGMTSKVESLGEAAAELRTQTSLWRKQCTRFTIILGDLHGRLTSERSAEQ